MNIQAELQETISDLVTPGRGILAADESAPTISKRFAAIDVESTPENRRIYRSALLTTPGIGEYISGVILFEETLKQKSDDGRLIPGVALAQGVVPGIKVDKGTVELPTAPGDKITQGSDGLAERLKEYKAVGARFAKWRAIYAISEHTPSALAIKSNAEVLARYASICQSQGLVPIVEPEVLMDGNHTLDRCAEVTEAVQHAVFHALHKHGVMLEYMLLKPNMVLPGKDHGAADPETIAEHTLRVLKRTVPLAVPSINFLSGGQTAEQASANLNAINILAGSGKWALSFSYARALQQPVMDAWRGDSMNINAAQDALLKRAKANAAACRGEYTQDMEHGTSRLIRRLA